MTLAITCTVYEYLFTMLFYPNLKHTTSQFLISEVVYGLSAGAVSARHDHKVKI